MLYLKKKISSAISPLELDLLSIYRQDGGAFYHTFTAPGGAVAIVTLLSGPSAIPQCSLNGVSISPNLFLLNWYLFKGKLCYTTELH